MNIVHGPTTKYAIAPEILVRAETETPARLLPAKSLHHRKDGGASTAGGSRKGTGSGGKRNDPSTQVPETLQFGSQEPFSLCNVSSDFWSRKPCPVACFHDHETFTGYPLSLPVSFDAKKKVFYVWGVFCSPGCMKRYVRDRRLPVPMTKLLGLMKLMLVMVYKIRETIVANPSQERLRKFHIHPTGGLTVQEFRARGTQGIHEELFFGGLMFTPVAVCMQKIVTHDELQDRLSQVDQWDKQKSRRLAQLPKGATVADLTAFYPVQSSSLSSSSTTLSSLSASSTSGPSLSSLSSSSSFGVGLASPSSRSTSGASFKGGTLGPRVNGGSKKKVTFGMSSSAGIKMDETEEEVPRAEGEEEEDDDDDETDEDEDVPTEERKTVKL